MASSNDRKISALPFNDTLQNDTTFIIVSDISTTPKNERINTAVLFTEIPVAVSVGKESDGRDVIFNTTLSPTNRLHFDSASGDLNLGRNLNVANSVVIDNDLTVTGTVYFNSITPMFSDLDITGNFSSVGSANVGTHLIVGTDATISGNTSIGQNLTVTGDLSVLGNSSFVGDVNVNYIESTTSNTVDLIVSNVADVETLNAVYVATEDLISNNSIIANGYIRSVGNVFGNIGSFTGLSISDNAQVTKTLTAQNIASLNNITANNLVTTDSLNALDISSANATISNLNSTLLTSIDVNSTNVNAIAITAVTLDVASFNIDTLSTNNFTSNNATIVNEIYSNTVNTSSLQLEIITTLPNANVYPEGTLKLYYDTVLLTYSLQLATSAGWQKVFLT